ncbi:hypothetical protein [Candidatus Aquicultor secundus]|uniref:hypothetical protein n=1 Tax=Candidatus Aquicultor secundus TaxID=1973895 RepID=UPI00257E15D8|nr:hypothetical protein [Candidatus Aquicultor secundus]
MTALMLIAGCGFDGMTKASDPEKQTLGKVPLMLYLADQQGKEGDLDKQKLVLATWDLNKGSISLGNKPTLLEDHVQGLQGAKLVWAGDNSALVCTTDALRSGSIRNGSSQDFKLEKVEVKSSASSLVVYKAQDAHNIMTAYWERATSGNSLTTNSNPKAVRIIVEIRKANHVEKRVLVAKLPHDPIGVQPLLVYGTPDNYSVLVSYDHYSKKESGAIKGSLILGNVNGKSVHWDNIKGEYCSFIAGGGSDLVKLGNKVFIDACGGLVMVLDLRHKPMKLTPYKPVNEQIKMIQERIVDVPVHPVFGAYGDILVMALPGFYDQWVWAIENDKCVGKIHLDSQKSKLTIYKDNISTQKQLLPDIPRGFVLPRDGYGTWK